MLGTSKKKDKSKMSEEQKHKEDLEAAKGWLAIAKENDNTIAIQILENLFPELRESEDERIRKELLEHCVNRRDGKQICVDASDYRRWAAWLEKQGESIKIKKGKNYLCTKTHKYAGVEWIEGVKYYSSEDYSLVNQGCTCYCPKYSKEEHNNFFKEVEYEGCPEKQGEQKYSWSEEDEKMVEDIIEAIDTQYAVSDYNEMVSWLKSLKPNHWKPSEYDISLLEEIARNIRNNVRPFCSEVSALEDLIKNLKNL